MYKHNLRSLTRVAATGVVSAVAVLGLAACGNHGGGSSTASNPQEVYMAQLAPLNSPDSAPVGVAQVTHSADRLQVSVTTDSAASRAMQVARIHSGSCDSVNADMESRLDSSMNNVINVNLDEGSASGSLSGIAPVQGNVASGLGQDIIVVHSVNNGVSTPIACGRLQTYPMPSPSASASPSASPMPSASPTNIITNIQSSQAQGQSQAQQAQVQSKTTAQSKSASTQSKAQSTQVQSKSTSTPVTIYSTPVIPYVTPTPIPVPVPTVTPRPPHHHGNCQNRDRFGNCQGGDNDHDGDDGGGVIW